MAWLYSNWRSETTPAAQLAKLNLHLQELSDAVTAEISGDGKSRSSNAIAQMVQRLEEQREKLQRRVGLIGGGVSITSHRGGSFSSPTHADRED
jgi:hypothetical protein